DFLIEKRMRRRNRAQGRCALSEENGLDNVALVDGQSKRPSHTDIVEGWNGVVHDRRIPRWRGDAFDLQFRILRKALDLLRRQIPDDVEITSLQRGDAR